MQASAFPGGRVGVKIKREEEGLRKEAEAAQ
jgi:hypothetical protein